VRKTLHVVSAGPVALTTRTDICYTVP
jgi:hypothetical protein